MGLTVVDDYTAKLRIVVSSILSILKNRRIVLGVKGARPTIIVVIYHLGDGIETPVQHELLLILGS